MNDLWLALGRFHPVLVHLPIGIFLLLGAWELAALLARFSPLNWLPRLDRRQRLFVLTLGGLLSVTTATLGWLLAREGGYDRALLEQHQNLGFVTAGLSVVLLVTYGIGATWFYGFAVVIMLVLLGLTGHRGGQITHGSDYLTQYLPAWLRGGAANDADAKRVARRAIPTDPTQAVVYADVVGPLLEERCSACHGPTKSNGDLRLDHYAELMKGGKHGAAFVAGDGSASLLLKRIYLPQEEKEHMPPKGKPQLTEDESALLEWWIEVGAPKEKTVAELNPPPAIEDYLANRFGPQTAASATPDRAVILAQALTLAGKLQIEIRALSPIGSDLAVNARLRFAQFGDAQLDQLAPIAIAIQSLDLGQTAITDAGLTRVATMKNLRRLQLDRTAVTDAGLVQLATLRRLESVNLYGTQISDAGLAALKPLTRLRSIYLWETKATPVAAKALGDQLVDRRKIQRWTEQVGELQNKIRAEHFSADFGAGPAPIVTPPTEPMKKKSPSPAMTPSAEVKAKDGSAVEP